MKKLIFILSILCAFSQNAKAQTYNFIEKIVAADRAAVDRFGYSVAISGNYAVVGAYGVDFGAGENRGAAYIFEKVGFNDWEQTQKIIASDQQNYDRFGWDVAIDGDIIVVGAYQEDHDVSGGSFLSNAGSAYIFEKNTSGVWVQTQKIVASDRQAEDEFGYSVAIHNGTIIIGARTQDYNAAGLSYIYNAGAAYIFNYDGSNWVQTQKIVATQRAADMHYPSGYSGEDLADQFGWDVAIWGDYIIVGALHHDYGPTGPPSGALWSSGAAFIFERNGMGVWNQVQKIQNFDRAAWDRFGCSVAIDTNIICVGAYSEDELEDGVSGPLTNPGSAYIFTRNGSGTWVFTQKIVPNDRLSGNHFGWSIDMDRDYMVIGTHSDDRDENVMNLIPNTGSSYIFHKDGSGVWSQIQKIAAFDRQEDDEFGIAVAISGHTVISGAFHQDLDEDGLNFINNGGAVYIYSNDPCPLIETTQNIEICFGETFIVGASNYTISGNYTNILSDINGCDSIVYTNLVVKPEISSTQNIELCFGETLTIGSTTYSSSGNYTTILSAVDGCDSLVHTDLTIRPKNVLTQNIELCFGETITVGTNTYNSNGNYTDILTDTFGCDSTVTTNLTILPENLFTQNIELCFGETISIGSNTYSSNGTYMDVLTSALGCDSTVTTNLIIQDEIFSEQFVSRCYGSTYTYLTDTYSSSGTYPYLHTAANGCDSTFYLHLTIEPENTVTHHVSICWGETYTIGLNTYNLPGIYTDVVSSSTFCDSIITTVLTIQAPVNVVINQNLNTLTAQSETGIFQWIDCKDDSPILGANQAVFSTIHFGLYAVIVNESGCIDTSSCIYINKLGMESNHLTDFNIFPNPNHGSFNVQLDNNEIKFGKIFILNELGQVIYVEEFESNKIFTFNNLNAGVYFVQIQTNQHVQTKKVIVH